jgi:hypothetical protein
MNCLTDAWTPSAREEVLFILYSILAVVLFETEKDFFGWVATIKAAFCFGAAIWLGIKEALQ